MVILHDMGLWRCFRFYFWVGIFKVMRGELHLSLKVLSIREWYFFFSILELILLLKYASVY